MVNVHLMICAFATVIGRLMTVLSVFANLVLLTLIPLRVILIILVLLLMLITLLLRTVTSILTVQPSSSLRCLILIFRRLRTVLITTWSALTRVPAIARRVLASASMLMKV